MIRATVLLSTFAAFGLSSRGSGDGPSPASDAELDELKTTLIELEADLMQKFREADIEAVDKLLAPEFVDLSDSEFRDKKRSLELLAEVRKENESLKDSGEPIEPVDLGSRRAELERTANVVPLSEDAAALRYLDKSDDAPGDDMIRLVTSTFARRDGQWICVLYPWSDFAESSD